jgi:hypothetical protein
VSKLVCLGSRNGSNIARVGNVAVVAIKRQQSGGLAVAVERSSDLFPAAHSHMAVFWLYLK